MSLTEANTIQEYILEILQNKDWKYLAPESIQRKHTDILLEEVLKKKLQDLNPEIKEQPQRADEVIYQLDKVIHSTQDGLIKANEEFSKWLKNDKTMRYGQNNQDISIKIIDFDNIENNSFQITKEYSVKSSITGQTKRADIILFVNGIPLVNIETKSPVRQSQSWANAASQISDDYESNIPELYASNVFNAATEGKELWYGVIGSDWEEHWEEWKQTKSESSFFDISKRIEALFGKNTILEMLQWYTIFATEFGKKIKMIARFPQYEAINLILKRVEENKIKQGLIWHWQGSGKSMLMTLAAMRLRLDQKFENPTVIIVVDRIDLDTQISGKFNAANVPNTVPAESRQELTELLKNDTRKVIITTIHKFSETNGVLNDRDNIIVLVDEADRTQDGDLSEYMRNALPNAFFFGLTGTPIIDKTRNTFTTFGTKEDGDAGELHRYSMEESIEDGTTLPINFETVPAEYKLDKKIIAEGLELLKQDGATDGDISLISTKAAKLHQFLISENVINKKAIRMLEHFLNNHEPFGFNAMIVAHNRLACVRYKDAIDKILPNEASEVIMTLTKGDPNEWYSRFEKTREEITEIQKNYSNKNHPLKILIVTQKLMRGFDASILQVMYLDKLLKDHGLLQAITRTNRPRKGKSNGVIVDYISVFDNLEKALTYDYEKISNVATNLEILSNEFPKILSRVSSYFVNLDKSLEGWEMLLASQECLTGSERITGSMDNSIKSIIRKESFATDFVILNKFWNKLHPRYTTPEQVKEYRFLAQIYSSIGSSTGGNMRIWKKLGPKTEKLIQDNIDITLRDDSKILVMDDELIRKIKKGLEPHGPLKTIEIKITRRINCDPTNPDFIDIAEKLEELKNRHNQRLISNYDLMIELLKLSNKAIKIEKGIKQNKKENKKNILTRIFEKSKISSKEIEETVEEIDDVVTKERFDGWQNTINGTKVIKQKLFQILYKHKLDGDEELFEKAYLYCREHY
jgi:type I restriction enzyme, R subunit